MATKLIRFIISAILQTKIFYRSPYSLNCSPVSVGCQQPHCADAILLNRKFTFALPPQDLDFNLPPGNHLVFTAMIDGELVTQPFVPMFHDKQNKTLEFVIKVLIDFTIVSLRMQFYMKI